MDRRLGFRIGASRLRMDGARLHARVGAHRGVAEPRLRADDQRWERGPGGSRRSGIERQIQGSPGASAPKLNHLIPARDSQGSLPSHFEWTPVPGADSYSVGIWNEVDMLIWRMDHITTNSFERPDTLRLEPGTYFWTISALRQGEEITTSGLSAFVVRPAIHEPGCGPATAA